MPTLTFAPSKRPLRVRRRVHGGARTSSDAGCPSGDGVSRSYAHLRACGGVTGAIFCVGSLASLPWVVAILQARGVQGCGRLAALLFAYTLGAALVGKVTGLLVAHVRLVRDLRDLHAQVQSIETGGARRDMSGEEASDGATGGAADQVKRPRRRPGAIAT